MRTELCHDFFPHISCLLIATRIIQNCVIIHLLLVIKEISVIFSEIIQILASYRTHELEDEIKTRLGILSERKLNNSFSRFRHSPGDRDKLRKCNFTESHILHGKLSRKIFALTTYSIALFHYSSPFIANSLKKSSSVSLRQLINRSGSYSTLC